MEKEENIKRKENTMEEENIKKNKIDEKIEADAAKEMKKDVEEPQKEDFEDKYMRLMADFQNYKRRVEKEKKDIYAYANEKLIAQLLDVLDNFNRAQEQVKSAAEEQSESAASALSEGLEMIYAQLLRVLGDAGLKEISAEEQSFDPELHDAVISEDSGAEKSGKVTEVLKKGYTYNDKVIRHSMVKVGI